MVKDSYLEDGANKHYETDDSKHDAQKARVLNYLVQTGRTETLQNTLCDKHGTVEHKIHGTERSTATLDGNKDNCLNEIETRSPGAWRSA